MCVDASGEVRLVVVGVRHIGGHIGVVAEERLVEDLHRGGWVAGALHTYGREVDVEVAAEDGDALGVGCVEVARFIGAAADEAGAVALDDAAIPTEGPTQRAHRIGQDLACVGAGVVRESLAGGPVGDPGIAHGSVPS